MNNPSSQAKMLMIEQMAIKADLMTKLCDDSNRELQSCQELEHLERYLIGQMMKKRDLLEQRMERAQRQNLEKEQKVLLNILVHLIKLIRFMVILVLLTAVVEKEIGRCGDGYSRWEDPPSGGLGGSFGGDDIPDVDLEDTEGSEGTETENDDTGNK